MGLRPRLSADAAFAAYWNPGLAPHRISLRLRARLLRLPLKGGVIGPWERGRPARILFLMGVAELQHDFAGSHHVGGNRNGWA